MRLIILLLALFALPTLAQQEDVVEEAPEIQEWERSFEESGDAPLEEPLTHPEWFKLSFLNLRDDLDEAVEEGKQGMIVYFGQKFCPYCRALMEANFGRIDIERYTRAHFDVVAINIHGSRPVTDLAGITLSEKALAEREDTDFTPALLFYDAEGREALRLRGYYPPYKFRAALEYVAGGHYRNEHFSAFLARANPPEAFDDGDLNEEPFFTPPPYALDRSRFPAENPLIVFFEQTECHACDVLHGQPLRSPEIQRLLGNFDAIQLGLWSEAPVITPDGRRTTARKWAEELDLFYTPTLLFFDQNGEEIMRVDSLVYLFRLQRVLQYVTSGVWQHGIDMQAWLREQFRESRLGEP